MRGKIAQVRGLRPGTAAISPPRFAELDSVAAFRDLGNHVRELTGGVPVGFKLSAQHVEKDIDFALEADAIALSNSAMQAIGCIAMRACSSINCPVGIATQREDLRRRLEIAASATRLKNFFFASVDLMKVLARACGHDHLSKLSLDDLSTYDEQMHKLAGVPWAGIS